MPTISGTLTVQTDLDVQIKTKLMKELRLIAQKRAQIKKLEAEVKTAVAAVEVVRDELNLDTFDLNGFTITRVAQTRSVRDDKKLIALGCKAEWLEKATVLVPSAPYTLVTVPK